MKYEEYEKRKKKEKDLEKVNSTQPSIRETISIDDGTYECGNLKREIMEVETNAWRRRWRHFWRSSRPSSNVKSSLT
jgi:hypothetical protein